MEDTKLRDYLIGSFSDSNAANLALLGMRLYAGYTIMRAGLDKIPLPSWMTDQVVQMGLPSAELFAWIASFSEFAFGLLLVLGLLSRVSGFFLAFTMGMATFLFHGLYPFVSMHLAQHFFWMFVVFAFAGGGKFSVDYLISEKGNLKLLAGLGAGALAILLSYGLYVEFTTPKPEPNQANVIKSVNVPGSFNEWNPKANKMEKKSEDDYELVRDFEGESVVDFKFTINESWEKNFGEKDQSKEGFPIKGSAELTKGDDTKNIRVYIPEKGKYVFRFNTKTFAYSVEKTS